MAAASDLRKEPEEQNPAYVPTHHHSMVFTGNTGANHRVDDIWLSIRRQSDILES
jgi:hypothetical protein